MSPIAASPPSSSADAAPKPLVLIVEDDPAIAEGLSLNLKLLGYRTEVALDGEQAGLRANASAPDLILLDITLPKASGLQVLETLRAGGNHVPVIVLSARQDEYDKVAALQLGADDYVTKPFALAELMARVAAVLRRAALRVPVARTPTAAPAGVATAEPEAPTPPPERENDAQLQFADVVLDREARTVTRQGAEVRLTHLEFELLTFLCSNPGRVFTREELLREVWGLRHNGTARTVDNFIAQLRAKIERDPDEPRHLVTIRGSGYRFSPS